MLEQNMLQAKPPVCAPKVLYTSCVSWRNFVVFGIIYCISHFASCIIAHLCNNSLIFGNNSGTRNGFVTTSSWALLAHCIDARFMLVTHHASIDRTLFLLRPCISRDSNDRHMPQDSALLLELSYSSYTS